MRPTRHPRFTASRFGIVVAAVIGFGIGATGFAAAQRGDLPGPVEQPAATPSPTTSVDDAPTTTIETAPTTTVDDGPTTVDDGPTTTVDDGRTTMVDDNPTQTSDSGPTTMVDDNPTTTVDDGSTTTVVDGRTTVEDGPTTTVEDGPTTRVDDGPTTPVDDSPTSTAPAALPAPFTTSYASAGGSISITWSGTAFTLKGVTPAPGFRAEIEHQSWDRVRVDFEGADRDARIEVRIDEGQLRVGID